MFDDANKQTSGGLSYDSHGNTTAYQTQSLGWNLLDQLSYSQTAQAVNCTYIYDGLGRRILRRTNLGPTTIYLFDGDLLLGEVTHSNVYPNAVSTSAVYTWGAAGLVSERIPSGSLFYHFGPQGETRQLTNASGAVVDAYLYTAYGQPVSTTGTDPNSFRYGGQFGYYTDTDPGNGGLILCGARWYSPSLGRWLSRDPIGYGGGSNLYEYCAANPLTWSDAAGTSLDDIKEFGKGFVNEVGRAIHGVESLSPMSRASNLLGYELPWQRWLRTHTEAEPYSSAGINGRDMARLLTVFLGTIPGGGGTAACDEAGLSAGGRLVELYHFTSSEGAQGIMGSGVINGSRGLWRPWAGNDVYFGTKPVPSWLTRTIVWGLPPGKSQVVVPKTVQASQVLWRPFGIRIVPGPVNYP